MLAFQTGRLTEPTLTQHPALSCEPERGWEGAGRGPAEREWRGRPEPAGVSPEHGKGGNVGEMKTTRAQRDLSEGAHGSFARTQTRNGVAHELRWDAGRGGSGEGCVGRGRGRRASSFPQAASASE